MHCTLESLSANDKLNAHLRALAQSADRNR